MFVGQLYYDIATHRLGSTQKGAWRVVFKSERNIDYLDKEKGEEKKRKEREWGRGPCIYLQLRFFSRVCEGYASDVGFGNPGTAAFQMRMYLTAKSINPLPSFSWSLH